MIHHRTLTARRLVALAMSKWLATTPRISCQTLLQKRLAIQSCCTSTRRPMRWWRSFPPPTSSPLTKPRERSSPRSVPPFCPASRTRVSCNLPPMRVTRCCINMRVYTISEARDDFPPCACNLHGEQVEQRPVSIQEVLEGKFSEIGACGTAVVGINAFIVPTIHTL